MVITTKLDLDLQRPLYPSVINAVQGDQNTRQLEISLYSGGVAFELPEGTTAAMRYGKPDSTKGLYDTMPDGSSAFSVSGNTVSILLAPQMLTVPGAVSAQVVLMHGANILSTFVLQVHVEEDPSAGVMESEDYTNWLAWIEAELDTYLEKLKVNGEFVGGTVVGAVNMNNQSLYGLREPAEDDQAATKGYVDTAKAEAKIYTNEQVKKAAPWNLIDNGYFEISYIINQRNAMSNNIKAGQYFWDRWVKGTDGTFFTLYGKWCGLAGSMYQIVGDYRRLSNVPVTLAVKIDNSIRLISAKVTYDGMAKILAYTDYINLETDAQDRLIVRIDTGVDVGSDDIAKVIKWAALYEGEYTLDTLPEHQPKGYAAELAECQRYYYELRGYWKWAAPGICVSDTQTMIPIKLPQAMRVKPTVTIEDTSFVRIRCGALAAQVPTSVNWDSVNTALDTMQMNCTVTGSANGDIAFLYLDNNGRIKFSADL